MPPSPAAAPPSLTHHPEFARGAREMGGVALGVAAWGLVTGVAMIKSGMGLAAALVMSLTVFAGSAQLASAPLMAAGAPVWVVWATALALNLRFVIFSTQWRPYFADRPLRQRALAAFFTADFNLLLFMRRFPEPRPAPEHWPYFWGGAMINAGAWHIASLLGIALGANVPAEWGLGFAGTVALLGMVFGLLDERSSWLPALVAGAAAVAAYALPLKLNLLVAIAAAVAVGAMIDHSRFGKTQASTR